MDYLYFNEMIEQLKVSNALALAGLVTSGVMTAENAIDLAGPNYLNISARNVQDILDRCNLSKTTREVDNGLEQE